MVIAALVRLGKVVLLPFTEHTRYDLVFEAEPGVFKRVQCKTGRVIADGAVLRFNSFSIRSRTGERRSYQGQIDLFGVYCAELNKVYLVPVDDVPITDAYLRLKPSRNSQAVGIHWAKDYEIGEP